jgi:hypothetical protein
MADTQAALASLTHGLTEALGGELVALMVYGSVARGTASPGHSDVNVLLVTKSAGPEMLRRVAPALAAWRKAGHPAPLIQTEAEWASAADVFPMEIEDIRDAHRLLAGQDVLAALTTTHGDLRMELEREVRGKLIRLRAEYAVRHGHGKALGELLTAATGTFLTFFRAALRLAGRPVPRTAAEVVGAAAALAGFEAAAFDWPLAARTGARGALPEGAADAFLRAAERFVGYINDA